MGFATGQPLTKAAHCHGDSERAQQTSVWPGHGHAGQLRSHTALVQSQALALPRGERGSLSLPPSQNGYSGQAALWAAVRPIGLGTQEPAAVGLLRPSVWRKDKLWDMDTPPREAKAGPC